MKLKTVNEFDKFKEEMKSWNKEDESKGNTEKIKLMLKNIAIMIISFVALVCMGLYKEERDIQIEKSKTIYTEDGEIFDITQYGDFREEFIEKYVNKENDYIIEDIDIRCLSEEELKEFTKSELALIRNEIFARNGYIFEDEPYNTYFNGKKWYSEYTTYVGYEYLSDEEKYNISLIKQLEEKR